MRDPRKIFLFTALLTLIITNLSAQILTERDRAKVVDDLLEERFETVLPGLMDQSGIDMWILI
ncbi:MAG: Xaa-Pro aminopeptidase, partial [Bacteroidia bacterium]|nr:Xaa-Pro aminopeptidase [Bacteroidia bacterium]